MTPVGLSASEIREKTFKILASYGIALDSAIEELAHIAIIKGTPEDCANDYIKTVDYFDAVTAYCMDRSTYARLSADEARNALLTGQRVIPAKTQWDRLKIGNLFTATIRDNGCSELYDRWLDISHWTREALGLDASEDEYRDFFKVLCDKHKRARLFRLGPIRSTGKRGKAHDR